MSRPKVKSNSDSIAQMPGSFRFVAIMECGWCGEDIVVDADNEAEAYQAFIEAGVRYVETEDLCGLFCEHHVDEARRNKLEA